MTAIGTPERVDAGERLSEKVFGAEGGMRRFVCGVEVIPATGLVG